MKTVKKILWGVLAIISLLCFATGSCKAAENIDCVLDVPAQNAINKSITATVSLSCGSSANMGVSKITVEYDEALLTYKECKLCSGVSGDIDVYNDGGILKIMYINPQGFTINNQTAVFTVKFTAGAATSAATNVVVYSSDNVLWDESTAGAGAPMQYTISLTDREITSNASANGTRIQLADTKSSKAQKDTSSAASKGSSKSKTEKSTGVTKEVESSGNSGNIIDELFGQSSDSASPWVYVAIGGGLVLAVVAVSLVTYKLGQKRAAEKLSDNQKSNEKETEDKRSDNDGK